MTANNRRFSRDRDSRMSVSSSMTFEKLFLDGSELFDVSESTSQNNNNNNDASNEASIPPVQFIKGDIAPKRPSAMEFESGEFFAGKDLVDVFTQPDTFRRRSTISRDRRDSMMSFATIETNTNNRRESIMSLMSLADCSLDETQGNVENNAAKILQDMNHPLQPLITVEDAKSSFTEEDSKNDTKSNDTQAASKDTKEVVSNDTDILSKVNTNTFESEGQANNDSIEYIEEIGPYDIICGRNNGAHNWVGNRRFRITIMMNLKRYTDAPTREEKTQVIKSVISMLQNTEGAGARFIKKVGENTYVRLKEKQIREKVGHAFRDMISLATQEGKLEEKCFQ